MYGEAIVSISDAKVRRTAIQAVERAALTAVAVEGPEEILRMCADGMATAIVVDLGPAGMSAADLCRRIRKLTYVPLIMVANGEDDVERVIALEVGADNVVDEDVSSDVLSALLKSLLRRGRAAAPQSEEDEVVVGPLTVQRVSRSARVNGRRVELSAREYALLDALVQRRGHVLSKAFLLERAWETPPSSRDRALAVYMARLRRKIGDDRRNGGLIETVHGIGYALRAVPPLPSTGSAG